MIYSVKLFADGTYTVFCPFTIRKQAVTFVCPLSFMMVGSSTGKQTQEEERLTIMLSIGKKWGYAIKPNLTKEQRAEILATMPAASRVAIVGLAPSEEIMALVDEMTAQGHSLAGYFDNHLGILRGNELVNVESIMARPFAAKIVDRKTARSCSSLIAVSEWATYMIDVVLFNVSADGYLSFIKGAGLTYKFLDRDAAVLNGAIKKGLSEPGIILANGINFVGPVSYYDRKGYEESKTRVFQSFAALVQAEFRGATSREFIDEVVVCADRARKNALEVAAETKLTEDGVALGNFIPLIMKGESPAIPFWRKPAAKKFENVLLCAKTIGHFGRQYHVELPESMREEVDIREYLPEGVEGRMSYRAQIPDWAWGKFITNWRNRAAASA